MNIRSFILTKHPDNNGLLVYAVIVNIAWNETLDGNRTQTYTARMFPGTERERDFPVVADECADLNHWNRRTEKDFWEASESYRTAYDLINEQGKFAPPEQAVPPVAVEVPDAIDWLLPPQGAIVPEPVPADPVLPETLRDNADDTF